jgi:hypothetical protein
MSQLKKALTKVKEFDDLARNLLNSDKNQVLATPKHLREKAEVIFDGHPLSVVKHIKDLGATIGSSFKPAHDDSNKRADKVLATAHVSKRSMAPWKFKKRVVRCEIQPQLCYGALFSKPTVANLRRLRTAVVIFFWGRGLNAHPTVRLLFALTPFALTQKLLLPLKPFYHLCATRAVIRRKS